MNFPWTKDKNPSSEGTVSINLLYNEIEYEITTYPDGAKYAKIIHFNDGKITYRINTYEDLWVLNQLSDILVFNKLQAELTIPFLLDGQADDRFNDNESFGLKLVCTFLNNMKGFAKINIFHPHNPQVVKSIIENVNIIDNFDFISDTISHIKTNSFSTKEEKYDLNNLILMSSDAGGFKALMKLTDKLKWTGETFSASKSRKYEHGITSLKQQVDRTDFGGKDILIVDDICVKGGTFKGLSKILKERNCGKLFLAVTHTTIQDLGDDPVTNYFDEVFTTNSRYDKYYSNGEVLDIKINTRLESIINKKF